MTQSEAMPQVVRAVLRLFPPRFRDRYGREMWQTVRDARRALGDRGFGHAALFWTRVLADLLRSAAEERIRSIPPEVTVRIAQRAAGLFLIVAALANIAYDAASEKLSMGIAAMLLTAVSAIAGGVLVWRRPRTPD